MARAAETAAHIASGSRTLPPQAVSPAARRRAATARRASGVLSLADRIALVERADRAARAFDPRIEKVIVELWPRRPSASASPARPGVLVEDVQPLFSIRVSRDRARERRAARGLVGGRRARSGPEFFETKPPE